MFRGEVDWLDAVADAEFGDDPAAFVPGGEFEELFGQRAVVLEVGVFRRADQADRERAPGWGLRGLRRGNYLT